MTAVTAYDKRVLLAYLQDICCVERLLLNSDAEAGRARSRLELQLSFGFLGMMLLCALLGNFFWSGFWGIAAAAAFFISILLFWFGWKRLNDPGEGASGQQARALREIRDRLYRVDVLPEGARTLYAVYTLYEAVGGCAEISAEALAEGLGMGESRREAIRRDAWQLVMQRCAIARQPRSEAAEAWRRQLLSALESAEDEVVRRRYWEMIEGDFAVTGYFAGNAVWDGRQKEHHPV